MLLNKFYRGFLPVSVKKKIYPFTHPLNAYVAYVIKKRAKQRVMSGPFKGMKLNRDNLYLPMLLGTYELEIHPVFDKLLNCQFDQIINGGANGGYYTVGMAIRWPKASVYAFETQLDFYYERILRLAKKNSVSDRVHIRGCCKVSDLINLLQPRKSTLLMLDVEGAEIDLLNLAAIQELRQATIIVELHDMFVPGCSRVIEGRFQNTHSIAKYTTRSRILEDFPLRGWNIINPITRLFAVEAMWERLVPQEYFLMIPKNAGLLNSV